VNKDESHAFNQKNIADFRASGGRITSFGEAPVLLLTTIGAKSGERRINPLMYLAGDRASNRVYVFASAAGADKNPDWLHNLLAHPKDLTVEIGKETLAADAQVVPDPARGQIFAAQAALYPGFAGYQEKTSRPIPVVELNLHR
jgi:deazaflavin-dependent oxidoreductase (nitroreductase family)